MATSRPSWRWWALVGDVRWFAPNPYAALVVPALRHRGLRIDLEGSRLARLAFAMGGPAAEAAWRYSRLHRCRLLVYLWDLPPRATGAGRADPVWYLAGRFVRVPRPWGGYRRRRGYFSRLRYIVARADAVWTASALTREIARERFGVSSVRVPYCYDSDRFRPSDTPRDHPPTLLTVSRLQPHKNQAATLRAAARLGREVRVRLIGRGPEASALERLAATLGVSCSIETGADDAVVTEATRTAAVAVCPSRFEGFGLTPIEAIGSGTPVVASAIPPHREYLEGAARFFPLDDDLALAREIASALEGPRPDPATVAGLTIPAAADRFATSLAPLLQ